MANEEQIQQKYIEFQELQQQIEQINQHLELLTQQNVEMDISIGALEELEKTKVGNEILAPIANGIFLKAELKDNQKLIVNVGSDTTVEKTIPEVIKLLEEQKVEGNQKIMELDQMLHKLTSQATKLYQEVEKDALQK